LYRFKGLLQQGPKPTSLLHHKMLARSLWVNRVGLGRSAAGLGYGAISEMPVVPFCRLEASVRTGFKRPGGSL
jgi:hypothetical protein